MICTIFYSILFPFSSLKSQVSASAPAYSAATEVQAASQFEYAAAVTPTVSAIAATSVSATAQATSVTVTGTLYSTTLSDNTVTIGGSDCSVTAATATQLVCTTGFNLPGTYTVQVHVAGLGDATSTTTFTYTADAGNFGVTSVGPTRGSTAGGTAVVISGTGFGTVQADVSVSIAGVACTVTAVTNTQVL